MAEPLRRIECQASGCRAGMVARVGSETSSRVSGVLCRARRTVPTTVRPGTLYYALYNKQNSIKQQSLVAVFDRVPNS